MSTIQTRKKKTYTKALTKGQLFSENIITEGKDDLREWDPRKSKLCAAMIKGMKLQIEPKSKVLYLGASHGYSASYVSDITTEGHVFCLDFAPRVVRDLVLVCERRPNMTPMLCDARKPETYHHNLTACDIVFQDIAQKNQVEIFLKNTRLFLKKGGLGYIAVKARSIDTTAEPKKIFKQVRDELEEELVILDYKVLEPFQRSHCMYLCRKK